MTDKTVNRTGPKLLYSSFGAPLVFFGSPYNSSEMVRSGFEEGSKIRVLMNVYRWTMS